MSENKVNNLLGVSMDKIKEMVDVNTVIGAVSYTHLTLPTIRLV